MSFADQLLATAHVEHCVALTTIFKLLGDPTRLRIVLGCLDEPKSVGDIATELGLSPSLVSKHLRLLRSARLVVGTRSAKRVAYGVSDDHIRTVLLQMLAHTMEEGVSAEAQTGKRMMRGSRVRSFARSGPRAS